MRLRADISDDSEMLITLLGKYLSERPNGIDSEMMEEMRSTGVGGERAYSLLLAYSMGLDPNGRDRQLYRSVFPDMIKRDDPADYESDPYFKNVAFGEGSLGGWSLGYDVVKPYELFVSDDIEMTEGGRLIPRVGYFDRELRCPAVTENGRVWMSVTPNEVNTMRQPINEARGRVLTFGLGLGYFQYMVMRKAEVEEVVCVERDADLIRLFSRELLPSFECPSKLRIIQSDAFDYADRSFQAGSFDFVFTDIWFGVADGFGLRREMQKREHLMPNAVYRYWIEKTLDMYED